MNKKIIGGIAALIALGGSLGIASIASATTAAVTKPTGITVSAVTSTSFKVSWSGASGETVNVQAYDASTLKQEFRGNLPNGGTVTGLTAGTANELRLDATSSAGNAGWTPTQLVYTTAAAGAAGAPGSQGTPGNDGATGPKGDAGATGPSGLQSVGTTTIAASNSVPTGGSFNSKAVQVGTITLPAAGTYLVSLNMKSEPDSATTGNVSAQFFVYNQVKNADFAGDLFNVSTDLQPYVSATGSSQHDAYASGAQVVTVDADHLTLYVYGFGYDADTSASEYNLIGGTADVVQLTPAS
jgi:hypothetical protein